MGIYYLFSPLDVKRIAMKNLIGWNYMAVIKYPYMSQLYTVDRLHIWKNFNTKTVDAILNKIS